MLTSLKATTWERVQQHWITVLLLSAVVITWLAMLPNVERLRAAETINTVVLSGAWYGALLALTRWRTRTAWAVSLLTSVGLAILIVGRILPDPASLFGQPFDKSVWLMNARLATLGEVLRSDGQWLLTTYLPQTRLFLLVNVVVVWNAAACLTWGVLRRRRALAAVLPLALLGVLYTAFNKDGPQISVLFIGACVLLVARTAYTYATHDWTRRNVGYPDLIGEDWTMWAALLAGAVIVLTGLSTPEWRSSLQRLAEALRPAPPPVTTAVPVRFDEQVSNDYTPSFVPPLDFVGESFPESDLTVFYVTTDDPPAGVESSGLIKAPKEKHYWRGAIFDEYTGSGWELLPVEVEAPITTGVNIPPGRYALRQQFNIISLPDNRLFAAAQPAQASAGTTLQAAATDDTAVLPRGRLPRYEITSWAPRVTGRELDAAGADYPADIRDKYLQLPDRLPQRVRDLAARLTAGATSPYDKAVRVQEYLRVTYPYKFDVPAPPPDRDVVDYFLFEAPGGFCGYFASAMTVMLRSQGVPARMVAGFATGEWDGVTRKYRVPARAAHAWVEVYFPGYGWIEFEPTSSEAVFDYTGAESTQPDQSPESATPRSTEAALTPIVIGALGALLLGMIGVAAYIAWRRYALSQLAPEMQARKLYWEMRRSLRQLGVEVLPSATPAEYRAACADRLADQPRLRHAIDLVIDSYTRAVFTATPPNRSEVRAAQRLWRATWHQRLRWRLFRRSRRQHAIG
jgi:hypothetical protein